MNDHYIKSARRYLAEEDMDRAKEIYERISARSECEDEARIAVLLCEYWEVRLTGYSKNYLPKGKELYEAVNNTGPLDIEFETLFPLLILKTLEMPNKFWQLNLTVSGVTDFEWLCLIYHRLKDAVDSDDFASINESRRSEMTEKLLEIEKKYSEAVSFLGPANIQAIASREEQEKLAHESVSNAKPRALHSDKNDKLDKARSCLRQHDFGKAAALYERFLDEDDELAAAEAELVLNYIEYRKVREAGDFKLMIEPCAALTESIIFYADNCEIDRDFASIIAELAVNLFSIPFDYSFSNMCKIHNYQNAPFFSIDIKHITPPLKKDFFEYKLPKAFAYFITEVIFADDEELQNPLERWKFDLCVAINNIDNYTNSAIRHQAGSYYVSDFELADSASYQRFYENRDKVYAFLKENGLLKAPSVQSQLATVLVLLLMSLPGIFVIYLFITHEI